MKVLLLHDYALPLGGAEIQTFRLRDALRNRGMDARVFSTSAGQRGSSSKADYECFGTLSGLRILSQTLNISAFLKLKRVLRSFKPDVVHVRMFLTQLSPLVVPLLREVPSLYHAVWYRSICPTGTKFLPSGKICTKRAGEICLKEGCVPIQDWLLIMVQMRMWNAWKSIFKVIVANSDAVKRKLLESGIEPVEVIPNGIEVPLLTKPYPLEGIPLVGFAGRLTREKGIYVLIEAFLAVVKKNPLARLIIAGGGPEEKEIRNRIAQYQLNQNIEICGTLNQTELEKKFQNVWIHAVPSIWEEPFGLSALEAMSRATAVVASDAGGLREIITHGENGMLVPPGNVQVLSDTLIELLADKQRIEFLGKKGRETVLEKFKQEIFVNRFIELYERIK